MKIARDTPQQLILAHVPWLFGAFLILFILIFVAVGLRALADGLWVGLLFVVIGGGLGLVAFAAFVRRVQLILDRPSGSIVLRRRSVFGYRQERFRLADLIRAELETTRSDGKTLFRPVLVLAGETLPVIESYTSTGGPRRLVAAINGWLAQGRVGGQADARTGTQTDGRVDGPG